MQLSNKLQVTQTNIYYKLVKKTEILRDCIYPFGYRTNKVVKPILSNIIR